MLHFLPEACRLTCMQKSDSFFCNHGPGTEGIGIYTNITFGIKLEAFFSCILKSHLRTKCQANDRNGLRQRASVTQLT